MNEPENQNIRNNDIEAQLPLPPLPEPQHSQEIAENASDTTQEAENTHERSCQSRYVAGAVLKFGGGVVVGAIGAILDNNPLRYAAMASLAGSLFAEAPLTEKDKTTANLAAKAARTAAVGFAIAALATNSRPLGYVSMAFQAGSTITELAEKAPQVINTAQNHMQRRGQRDRQEPTSHAERIDEQRSSSEPDIETGLSRS